MQLFNSFITMRHFKIHAYNKNISYLYRYIKIIIMINAEFKYNDLT